MLPPTSVYLPAGATGEVASQWRPAWAELGLPGPPGLTIGEASTFRQTLQELAVDAVK